MKLTKIKLKKNRNGNLMANQGPKAGVLKHFYNFK